MTAQYGNRGMTFEAFIEFANARYKADETAIVEKQHTKFIPLRDGSGRVVNCKVEEKATVDYMGRFGDRPIAFEAKHCSKDVIALNRVESHQEEFLRRWVSQSDAAIGFVLVSFKFLDFYVIPWAYWEMAQIAKKQKMPRTGRWLPMTTDWTATGKASIRKDELPGEWKVKTETMAGLDYLERVSALWRVKA
jgi:recombination protein U